MHCSLQAPLSTGFSRQEYRRGCHSLLQGNLPYPGLLLIRMGKAIQLSFLNENTLMFEGSWCVSASSLCVPLLWMCCHPWNFPHVMWDPDTASSWFSLCLCPPHPASQRQWQTTPVSYRWFFRNSYCLLNIVKFQFMKAAQGLVFLLFIQRALSQDICMDRLSSLCTQMSVSSWASPWPSF